jgi:hypothetical protein
MEGNAQWNSAYLYPLTTLTPPQAFEGHGEERLLTRYS